MIEALQVLGHEVEENYELVADLDTWDLDVPVQRFIDKLTQQYAVQTIVASTQEEGFVVEEKKVSNNGSIEIFVNRWN